MTTTPDTFLGDVDVREIDWATPGGAPATLTPQRVSIGNGADSLEVALATAVSAPRTEALRRLWALRWSRRAAPVLVVVAYPAHGNGWKASVCGTREDPAVVGDLDLGQVERICAAALSAPDPVAADRTVHRLLVGQKDQLVAGLVNSGLFASHELRVGVPNRADWQSQRERAIELLYLRGLDLIRGLGFMTIPRGSTAFLMTANGAPQSAAVLLEGSELFDRPAARFGAASPVSHGLAVAQANNVPWLVLIRGTQLRLYSAKPNIGIGRKGQTETFTEVDLGLLAPEHAAYLTLLFSADALVNDGTVSQIMRASADHATALGQRLRERVYQDVVPGLATALAKHLGVTSEEGLQDAYHCTLIILFRLLFIAYAEDRSLLPYQRNPRYTAKALKTRAREFAADPDLVFDPNATDRWDELLTVWRAIDDSNSEWGVPAYNGGLFAVDENHPSGAAIARMRLTNAEIGPALRGLLIDNGPDGVGPVDFRSLSVREFGTIYEGLLESSLSIAPSDLHVDEKTRAYVPAKAGESVEVSVGEVYFHNSSGARKSSGSYFTKQFVVEYLLDTALEPALTHHLARVRAALDSGDDAEAADLFFDFRIADLAMGSGHFLVAAIDRIENRLSAFLATHPILPVNEELSRLAIAAREALGSNALEVEIEPSALLRRQIARRCIYGLDVNLMAVELARLGIWIHTFVPGLPMSALDHNLIVGNSLTGIGSVDEVLEILEPQRSSGADSLFAHGIEDALAAAREWLLRAARTSEATKQEVRDAARAHAQALRDTESVKALFDAALAVRLGLILPPDSMQDATTVGSSTKVHREIEQYQPVHLPYRFPEVFLRGNFGFDVLIGNPPWEKVRHEPHPFWILRDPGLRGLKGKKRDERIAWLRTNRPQEAAEEKQEATRREALKNLFSRGYALQRSQHYDFAKVFTERNLDLVRKGGAVGIVLPQALLMLDGWAPLREVMIRDWHMTALPLRNRNEWLFEGVEGRMTVCLVSLSEGSGVTVHAAADSLPGFMSERERAGLELAVTELSALSDDLNVPWFEHPDDPAIFTAMARFAHLGLGTGWITGTADSTRWDFSGSGKHRSYATERDTVGCWRVTMTRHVDMYALTSDPDGKRIPRPQALVGNTGVRIVRGEVMLDETHPPIIFRFPTRNDDSRTLIATALPESGWLYSKGYAHGIRISSTTPSRDILALLGYLNSIPADWWARRFVDRHLGKRIIDGLPLPDWTEAHREQVARRVATLLRRNGYTNLAGSRTLPDALPCAFDNDKLRAQIDAYALHGLRLSVDQANTMFLDFLDSKDGLPVNQRTAILAAFTTMQRGSSD